MPRSIFTPPANPAGLALAETQFARARNMTDKIAALGIMALQPGAAREDAPRKPITTTYQNEPLAIDKWFALQAAIPEAGTLARVKS